MSPIPWDEVAERSELSARSVQVARGPERVRMTAEVFTPTALVVEMLQSLPREALAPGKRVLDPACGDGQFLVAVKWAKVLGWGVSETEALSDIFGVDILAENVRLCRSRLGGGTIVVGDTLHPTRRVAGQPDADYMRLQEMLAHDQLARAV